MTTGKRIKERRKQLGISAEQLADSLGVSATTIYRYEKGDIEKMPVDILEPIARLLATTPAWLMGWEDSEASLPANVTRAQFGSVPLIGAIACGAPILAEEHIEEFVDLPRHIKADFALTCKGDSMIGAGIQDGDVVYIRQQDTVDNGQIAAVLVDSSEATLKRFYFDGQTVSLLAENPAYPPLIFPGEQAANIRVIGRAVAYTHGMV